jgi:hypothetical protein
VLAYEIDEALEAAMVRALAQKSSFRVGTPLETRDELWNFIATEYGFQIPRTPVCVDHCSPFDALADSYFDVVQDMIWIGPRTGGKTLQFAILDHLCMMHFGDTIANVGAIEEQALKCYEYLTRFCNLPQFRHLIKGQSLISKTSFHNGARVEILPATPRRVNSPHPRRAHWDEIEQTEWSIIQEGLSMPMRVNGRPPVTIYTSSRKKATGPMERMLREAVEKNLKVYKWCAFEVVKRCPPTRHQNGVGCNTCPIEEICRERTYDAEGNETVSLIGRAARADGWMEIDDLASKYRSLDTDVFDAQWLSKKPQTRGLAYPMWDEDIHVIDYTWNRGLPVVSGIDFGFTNPSVAVYLQPLPSDDIVVFAEDYRPGRTADEFAMSIKSEPWFASTIWRVADPADAGDRQTLQNHGVKNEAADKACTAEEPSSVVAGINLVRWLLRPKGRKRPILYVAKQCVNLRREMGEYHHPEETETRAMNEKPIKKDDHACDALRYACRRLFRGGLAV